ncbi:hypothetical protein PCNPT3_01185 [Psychromonas sp. CNPT3]|uniref:DUF2868 domain-containing protein n=1 Tax=Psychromonas sp. CNPT3 TaxID=314282 RepID=UPI00006E9CB1|nr:DUF2868 domain-containing protein [Psychromonas sp. CNPT3]AGH80179.1 hypothetical protein PCNPT3_01185 [Psychromonas sp. CNPT3]
MQKIQPYLLADIIREIEQDLPTLDVQSEPKVESNFSTLLCQRSLRLDKALNISPLLHNFKRLTQKCFCLFGLLFFCLGASAVQQFFFSAQGMQVNFFWAFSLFFLPNLIMFFVWLFLFFRPLSLQSPFLGRLSLFFINRFEKYRQGSAPRHVHFWCVFKAYFGYAFSGKIGRYQLSCLTHLLWFSYFSGAILMLLLMLATHQVDFIWQSSLLSAAHLQTFTQSLATIPHLLGIPVPSAEQIASSHLGIQSALNEGDLRFVWSMLLISSFALYGALPRLCLLLLMHYLLGRQHKHYAIDESLFYYVQLRQKLLPNSINLGVVDADKEGSITASIPDPTAHSVVLPSDFFALAIELSDASMAIASRHLKTQGLDPQLENICDHRQQQKFIDAINEIQVPTIVIYVALKQLPDRGLKRLLTLLHSSSKKTLYVLLIDDGSISVAQGAQRLSQWYQLLLQADISLDNIMQLRSQHD